jgi:hypothetical protein
MEDFGLVDLLILIMATAILIKLLIGYYNNKYGRKE